MMGQMVGSIVERTEEHTVEDILVCMAEGSIQAVEHKQAVDNIQA